MNRKEKIADKFTDVKKKIPMGDDDIKVYFPNAKIIRYCELKDIKHIDELLPHDKSCIFLLYQDSPYEGHWVGLNKINNKIEFFDSYGGAIDSPLKWVSEQRRHELGILQPYLSILLKNSGYPISYNKTKFQDNKIPNINTCGRHCVFRMLNMVEKNRDNKGYENIMKEVKSKMKTNYDKIVSLFINE